MASDNQSHTDPSTAWAMAVVLLGLMALIGWVAWLILG